MTGRAVLRLIAAVNGLGGFGYVMWRVWLAGDRERTTGDLGEHVLHIDHYPAAHAWGCIASVTVATVLVYLRLRRAPLPQHEIVRDVYLVFSLLLPSLASSYSAGIPAFKAMIAGDDTGQSAVVLIVPAVGFPIVLGSILLAIELSLRWRSQPSNQA